MATHGQSEGIIDAEKGNNLSPKALHIRLRVLEVVTLLSLVLNLALWFFAGNLNSKVNDGAAVSATAPR